MALGDLISTLGADPLTGATDLSSPQAVERKRMLANLLMREGMDSSPIRSPWQGAARLANALMGGYQNYRADEMERAGKADFGKNFASLLQPQATGSVTPNPSPSPSPAPQASGDFLPTFAQAGTRHGISPEYLSRTAQIESGMNPQARNPSGAAGLMQFMPSTAKQYGLTNPNDPQSAIDAAARLAADNKRVLVASLGRNPTDAELYLAHQQGAGGASKLLANPGAPASSIVGEKAVLQNGGKPGMTAGEFAGMWLNKFGGAPARPSAAPVQTAQASPQIDQAKLMAVMSNPWATPAQQQIAATLLQRETKQESWGAPERDEAGNMIQRNARTGEVKILSAAKSPVSVGEGQTLIDPTTGKVIATGPQKRGIETDVAARRKVVELQGGDPIDPRNQQFINTGKYPREDAQPLTSTDKKAIMTAEDENAVLAGTKDALTRAKELNDKTFTGVTAGARGWAGTAIPGAGMLFDEGASKATREFGQLMSGEAIKQMSQTLKGATTDREMARFLEILADPSTPTDIRGRTIDRMIKLADRQKAINDSRINDLRGGSYFKPGGSPTGATSSGRIGPEEAAKLPSGTPFIGLDGIERVKH